MTPEEHVLGYVRKCGGIEKVERAIELLQAIAKEGGAASAEFVRELRPEGAKQLLVSAVLGNTLAAMTYYARESREGRR